MHSTVKISSESSEINKFSTSLWIHSFYLIISCILLNTYGGPRSQCLRGESFFPSICHGREVAIKRHITLKISNASSEINHSNVVATSRHLHTDQKTRWAQNFGSEGVQAWSTYRPFTRSRMEDLRSIIGWTGSWGWAPLSLFLDLPVSQFGWEQNDQELSQRHGVNLLVCVAGPSSLSYYRKRWMSLRRFVEGTSLYKKRTMFL